MVDIVHGTQLPADDEWAAWYSSVPDTEPRYRALAQILSFAFDRQERVKMAESLVLLGARHAGLLAAAVKGRSLDQVQSESTMSRASDMSLPLTTQHTLHRTLGAVSEPTIPEVCSFGHVLV